MNYGQESRNKAAQLNGKSLGSLIDVCSKLHEEVDAVEPKLEHTDPWKVNSHTSCFYCSSKIGSSQLIDSKCFENKHIIAEQQQTNKDTEDLKGFFALFGLPNFEPRLRHWEVLYVFKKICSGSSTNASNMRWTKSLAPTTWPSIRWESWTWRKCTRYEVSQWFC